MRFVGKVFSLKGVMKFDIGDCFDKRGYDIRQKGRGPKNRYNKIGQKIRRGFSLKGVMKFVIGGCFDKRDYDIRQERQGPKIGTIK